MNLTVRVDPTDHPVVETDGAGNVRVLFQDVTLSLPQDVADQLISDVMLAIAQRDLGSPLLRDESVIRMDAVLREDL